MIEVTMLFKDQEQFSKFLEKNDIEDYTWHKGKITIDLSKDVATAKADLPTRKKEIEASSPAEPAPASSTDPMSGMFS